MLVAKQEQQEQREKLSNSIIDRGQYDKVWRQGGERKEEGMRIRHTSMLNFFIVPLPQALIHIKVG